MRIAKTFACGIAVAGTCLAGPVRSQEVGHGEAFSSGAAEGLAVVGDPAVLERVYADWKAERREGAVLEFALRAAAPDRARRPALAWARLDLERSRLVVEGELLEEGSGSLRFEVGAEVRRTLPLGRALDHLEPWPPAERQGFAYEWRLEPEELGLALDGLRVSQAGSEGAELAELPDLPDLPDLIGGPGLFERLLAIEALGAQASALPGSLQRWAGGDVEGSGLDWGGLVALGERLFFVETFDGNGRTCGTCHPAENNLTIDPAFIATLPPDDPLFVAETNPDLNHLTNGGLRFENPVLMRTFGLIVVNADGFGDLANRFVMRSVPALFGLSASIKEGDGLTPPDDRLGWSGDGSPVGNFAGTGATGRLRDFPLGAVFQHFPKTLARTPGVDFRFPTTEELDAFEAFQLSLGRQGGFDLFSLSLSDPEADLGRLAYRSTTCNSCHRNAGAGSLEGENINLNSGVEAFLLANPDGTGEPRPIDGGFGRTPFGALGPPVANPDGSFGNRAFNATTLVTFADTLPAFHNHVIDTVEESIEFYASDEFFGAAGFKIEFTPTEVAQVGRFLRVINSMDNLDGIRRRLERARELVASRDGPPASAPAAVLEQARLALADVRDVRAVLGEVGLHPGVVQSLGVVENVLADLLPGALPEEQGRLLSDALRRVTRSRHALGSE